MIAGVTGDGKRSGVQDMFEESLAIRGSATSIIRLTTAMSSEMRVLGSAATTVPGQQYISGVNSIHNPSNLPLRE